jgi:hypothetical protein
VRMSKFLISLMFVGILVVDILTPENPNLPTMWNVFMGFCLFWLVMRSE